MMGYSITLIPNYQACTSSSHHIQTYSTIIYQKSIFTNTKSQMYDLQQKIKKHHPNQWFKNKKLSFHISIIPIIPNYTSSHNGSVKHGCISNRVGEPTSNSSPCSIKTHDYGRKSSQIVNCCFGAHPTGI